MSFRHLGEVINGEKIAKDWGKVTENYYLEENGDSTQLKIAMDSAPEFEDYMKETFPKAIAILKEICETQPKL